MNGHGEDTDAMSLEDRRELDAATTERRRARAEWGLVKRHFAPYRAFARKRRRYLRLIRSPEWAAFRRDGDPREVREKQKRLDRKWTKLINEQREFRVIKEARYAWAEFLDDILEEKEEEE